MIRGKSPDGFGLDATGDAAQGSRRTRSIVVRFRKGPVIAISASAFLWMGLVAIWRWL